MVVSVQREGWGRPPAGLSRSWRSSARTGSLASRPRVIAMTSQD